MDAEGHRWFTLTRTGTLVERVREYNPEASSNIQDYPYYQTNTARAN